MTASLSRLTVAAGFARAHGLKIGLEASANFILPFFIYSLASRNLGPAQALMAASAAPVSWSILTFIRERKIDAISVLVLSGIALSLLAFAGGGGVRVLQLRENLVAGLVGLVFLGSAAIGRPLIYQLARAGVRRRAAHKVGAFERLRQDAAFRRAMMTATLVWGFGLLATCAANCVLVFLITIKQFLLVSAPISYASMGLLTAWTFWQVPRAMRQAEARAARSE
jgi:hypothetical protein